MKTLLSKLIFYPPKPIAPSLKLWSVSDLSPQGRGESRGKFEKGQALTEYALLIAVTVFSLVIVNKLFIDVIGKALKRIIEIVSIPFP